MRDETSKEVKEYNLELISLKMRILELEKEILILKSRIPTLQIQGNQTTYNPFPPQQWHVTC